MYKRLKDCFISPKNIANYVDKPAWQTICHFLFLLILYMIPMLLIFIGTNTVSSKYGESIVSDLAKQKINYVLEDGKLKSTTDTATLECVETSLVLSGVSANVYIVFDLTDEKYLYSPLLKKTSIVLLFTQDHLKILSGRSNALSGGYNEVASKESFILLSSKTYEELNVQNIDFNKSMDNDRYELTNQVCSLVNRLYQSIKKKMLPLIIFILVIGLTSSYLVSILFIALLEKFLYRLLAIPFKKIFVIVLLSSTPYVILTIIGDLIGLSVLSLLGDILMLIYSVKAMMNYKIKYMMENNAYINIKSNDVINNEEEKEGDDQNV